MRLLDLFCGAGGAAMGYSRAGFEVVGVDIKPQPHYPFEFVQGDAVQVAEFLPQMAQKDERWRFDAIHASPPCQRYSPMSRKRHLHPDLYAPTRAHLEAAGLPYVIENVIGAPYRHGIYLCGSMLGLSENGEWIQRHRNFETSWFMFQPACAHPASGHALLVTGHGFITEARDFPGHSRQGPFDLACRLMGIDWMDRRELVQAIPPAYTEWIGRQLLASMAAAA